jgi:hypothetical protein
MARFYFLQKRVLGCSFAGEINPDTMGRIFETRKHKMFARYDKMAKAFTRGSQQQSAFASNHEQRAWFEYA